MRPRPCAGQAERGNRQEPRGIPDRRQDKGLSHRWKNQFLGFCEVSLSLELCCKRTGGSLHAPPFASRWLEGKIKLGEKCSAFQRDLRRISRAPRLAGRVHHSKGMPLNSPAAATSARATALRYISLLSARRAVAISARRGFACEVKKGNVSCGARLRIATATPGSHRTRERTLGLSNSFIIHSGLQS